MYNPGKFNRLSIALSAAPATIVCSCFDKSKAWVLTTTPLCDFRSVVLIRMLPGALNRLILPMASLFWITLRGVYYYRQASSSAKLDSLERISAATFRIIGLTDIKFLPLDWIYRSIRIMTVAPSMCIILPTSSSMRAIHGQVCLEHGQHCCPR